MHRNSVKGRNERPNEQFTIPRVEQKIEGAQDIQEHMLGTYTSLRRGLWMIAFSLPIVLGIGGLLSGVTLQDSMSSYYETPLRDIFVGSMWAIGIALLLYKGYSNGENRALNIGGIAAVLVALFPLNYNPEWLPIPSINPHGICAVLLFLCTAYVCYYRAADTLALLSDTDPRKSKYKDIYQRLAIAMIVAPCLTWLSVQGAAFITSSQSQKNVLIFVVETIAMYIFGSYWFLKGREINEYTDAEKKALEGRIKPKEVGPGLEEVSKSSQAPTKP